MSTEFVVKTKNSNFELEEPFNYTGRYQIYRGLSPLSTSRLENRLRELETALEFEKQARYKAESEIKNLHFRFNLVENELNQIDGLTSTQEEFTRQQDAEIERLRKELELATNFCETKQADWFKKYQHDIRDLADMLEKSNNAKNNVESDMQLLIAKANQLAAELDLAGKEKSAVDSKLRSLNELLKQKQVGSEEHLRQYQEMGTNLSSLQSEVARLKNSLDAAEGDKLSLKNQLAQLKTNFGEEKEKYEEECRQRNQSSMQLTNLQIAHDSLLSKCGQVFEANETLRNQVTRSTSDLEALRTKHALDVKAISEDLESNRWKHAATVQELEERLKTAKQATLRHADEKNHLQIQIRNFENQLGNFNSTSMEWSVRLAQANDLNQSLELRMKELERELSSKGEENRSLHGEILRLRKSNEDMSGRIDSLQREIKRLQDNLQESRSNLEDQAAQLTLAASAQSRLQLDVEAMGAQLAAAKAALKEALARLEVAAKSLADAKVGYEKSIAEKMKEINDLKQENQLHLSHAHKLSSETEAKYSVELGKIKSRFEVDVKEFRVQLDELAQTNGLLNSESKAYITKIKEYEMILEEEKRRFEEVSKNWKMSQEKEIMLLKDLEDYKIQLDHAQRARRRAENDLSEAQCGLTDMSLAFSNMSAGRKQSESELENLRNEIAEFQRWKMEEEEKGDKMKSEINKLTEELANEKDKTNFLESAKRKSDSEIGNLSSKVEEMELLIGKEYNRHLTNLNKKIQDLTLQLSTEQKRTHDLSAEANKLLKQLADARLQLEAEAICSKQLTEQLSASQLNGKTLRRQLNDAEEALNAASRKCHRLQRSFNEISLENESNQVVRVVCRPLPGQKSTRSMSVTRNIVVNNSR